MIGNDNEEDEYLQVVDDGVVFFTKRKPASMPSKKRYHKLKGEEFGMFKITLAFMYCKIFVLARQYNAEEG